MADDTRTADSGVTVTPIFEGGDSQSSPSQVVEPVTQDSPATDSAGTQSEDGDKTTQRVQDTQSALKEAQRQYHEMRIQLAELKGQLTAERQLMVEQAKADSVPEPAPDPLANREAWDSKYANDPVGMQLEMLKAVRGQMAALLDERDKELLSKAANLSSPERLDLRQELDALGKLGWFQKLSSADQLQAARDLKANLGASRPQGSGPLKASKGGPAGTGRADEPVQVDERRKIADVMAQRIWPTQRNDGKVELNIRS